MYFVIIFIWSRLLWIYELNPWVEFLELWRVYVNCRLSLITLVSSIYVFDNLSCKPLDKCLWFQRIKKVTFIIFVSALILQIIFVSHDIDVLCCLWFVMVFNHYHYYFVVPFNWILYCKVCFESKFISVCGFDNW